MQNYSDYKNTGKVLIFENGKGFQVYKKMSIKGVRYYRYSNLQMRMFPISKSVFETL